VFGLHWRDLTQDQAIRIRRIYARGKVSEPKTKKSKASIAVPAGVFRDVLKLQQPTSDTSEGKWLSSLKARDQGQPCRTSAKDIQARSDMRA
jgi:hypothetical protein